jgi:hypothetical protein
MRLRSIISLVTLFAAVGAVACSSSTNGSSSGAVVDAGGGDDASDAGTDSPTSNALGFKPSNVDLSGIDLSKITDETSAGTCEIRVGISSCFNNAAMATVTQSDGSKLAVFVVKSWKVEPTAHVFLSAIGGKTWDCISPEQWNARNQMFQVVNPTSLGGTLLPL